MDDYLKKDLIGLRKELVTQLEIFVKAAENRDGDALIEATPMLSLFTASLVLVMAKEMINSDSADEYAKEQADTANSQSWQQECDAANDELAGDH